MGLPGTAIALAVSALLCAGCGSDRGNAVHVVGSTSILPFAEMLAEEFNRNNADVRVEVQGGGSTAGIQAVTNGTAQIGTCSRSPKPEESGFTTITIARDGIAIVVHPSNKVNGLTREQIRDIFTGKIANWKEMGGEDKAITLVTREQGSGTHEAFTHLVMGDARFAASALTRKSSGAVNKLVESDPGAIGYMSLALVHGELKALTVDGVKANAEDVLNGTYPLVRPFLFVVKGTPSEAAQKFIDFVLSPPAQQILEKEGLVRAK
ncbi:MAG TPA: phosphate ABC transporter substrate-binding protein [Planctomycetota bacterium]|nr:phosphate ABC transporter substrate-binding protein [Planctomycetota bacterium]